MQRFLLFLTLCILPCSAFAQNVPSALPQIPYVYVQEAEDVRVQCEGTFNDSRFYDCECMAATFLQDRMLAGPEESRDSLLREVRRKTDCRDAMGAAGSEFSACLSSRSMLPDTVKPGAYCECYANAFATTFEKGRFLVSPRALSRLKLHAHTQCR